MKGYLTIGQTAKRLGLQVDTVRRLERQGLIRSERTKGRHRRFREEEVERLCRSRGKPRRRPGSTAKRPKAPPRRAAPAGPTSVTAALPRSRNSAGTLLDAQLDDAFDDVDDLEEPVIVPIPRPTPSPVPAARRSAIAPPAPTLPPSPSPPPSPWTVTRSEADAKASREREEASRLQTIKNHGLGAIPYGVPASWRGQVIADLERFVTATQFPSYLSLLDAKNIVLARVEEVLRPYHKELARDESRQRAKQEEERRLETLRSHGRNYAQQETSDWDWSAAVEARGEVEQVLSAEVEADWSEREVTALVDEILDQWDNEDDDEDDSEDD